MWIMCEKRRRLGAFCCGVGMTLSSGLGCVNFGTDMARIGG
nr:MAG TPA: CRISPR associated protein Cas6 [Caudoviricetes sp.]